MDIQYTGKLLEFLDGGPFNAALQAAEVGSATHIGKVFLGEVRFLRFGGRKKLITDTYIINEHWRPFSHTVAKRERKIADETLVAHAPPPFRMCPG